MLKLTLQVGKEFKITLSLPVGTVILALTFLL